MFGPSLLKTLMPLASGSYVPALRWRLAEYQALLRMKEPAKNSIVPLITIPPIEFDFETETLKKTVHEHVHPFVARYVKKWGWRPSWLTLDESLAGGRMDRGEHVFDYLLDKLRERGTLVMPALRLGADAETKTAAARAVAWDKHGVGVIVRLEELMGNDVGARVLALVDELGGSPDETDVLIDMAAPNYEPYAAFANALVLALGNMGDTDAFRNLVLVGTAIPGSFASLAKGSDEIPRHDWLFYRVLLENLPVEVLAGRPQITLGCAPFGKGASRFAAPKEMGELEGIQVGVHAGLPDAVEAGAAPGSEADEKYAAPVRDGLGNSREVARVDD